MPVRMLSATHEAGVAATAASAADPPAASTPRPTSVVAGWPAATPAGTRTSWWSWRRARRCDAPRRAGAGWLTGRFDWPASPIWVTQRSVEDAGTDPPEQPAIVPRPGWYRRLSWPHARAAERAGRADPVRTELGAEVLALGLQLRSGLLRDRVHRHLDGPARLHPARRDPVRARPAPGRPHGRLRYGHRQDGTRDQATVRPDARAQVRDLLRCL